MECSGFIFYNDFDSANLAKVEYVPPNESAVTPGSRTGPRIDLPDYEFNVWTKADCAGTEYENGNRTWFYFGIRGSIPGALVRINIVDINKQGKMYSQGMAPVYRIIPTKPNWERIKDKPVFKTFNNIFVLSFKYRTPENTQSVSYFAFTYPFPYEDLQKLLVNIDAKYLKYIPVCDDDIYYHRECVCLSNENRRIDLLTITSYHGITPERETRLKNLFVDLSCPRAFKFVGKKVIFVSARVHPGETPSSFVFNGLLNLLLSRDDPIAVTLRKLYVFKMIPILNPDGVVRGHYRTDVRGINLNRIYACPSFVLHPSIYAARALIRYHHFGYEKEDYLPKCQNCIDIPTEISLTEDDEIPLNDSGISKKVSNMSLEEDMNGTWCLKCKNDITKLESTMPGISNIIPTFPLNSSDNSAGKNLCRNCGVALTHVPSTDSEMGAQGDQGDPRPRPDSGLFLYLDLHGHASKKGVFIYGNHFEDLELNVECMLLPKLMSINNQNFHFTSCNFTERNMFIRDKRDGLSKAGSGRVSVLSMTGLIKSYTLECNYNTGRLVNMLPPTVKDHQSKQQILVPPKYTPHVFEEVGRSLGASILDLTGENPCSRLPNSEFHSLGGLEDWLRINCSQEQTGKAMNKLKAKTSPNLQPPRSRGLMGRSRPPASNTKSASKKTSKGKFPVDRKENVGLECGDSSIKMVPSASSDMVKRSKTAMKINKTLTKSKSKKDLSLKNKNSNITEKAKTNMKPKTAKNFATSSKMRIDYPAKLKSIKETKNKASLGDNPAELDEICYIKNATGKAVVAKYKNKKKSIVYEDNLLVTWDANQGNSKVYNPTPRLSSRGTYLNKIVSEPGSSRQTDNFRVQSYPGTSTSLVKAKKLTLRRLGSSSESVCKIDKLKKKKKLLVK